MKLFFTLFILVSTMTLAEVSPKIQSLFGLYDNARDIDLGSSGITVKDAYEQRIMTSSDSRIVELTPKKSGRDKITIEYNSKGDLVSFFKRDARSGITLLTSFTEQFFHGISDSEGGSVADEISFGENTLICRDHNVSGMDPKNNRICVMANTKNCDGFYFGMENVDRSTISTCNQIFYRMFKNNQIPQSSNLRSSKDKREIPTSSFYSFANQAAQRHMGESVFFHFFRDKDIDDTGMGSVLEFLNLFHTACEYYRSPKALPSNILQSSPSRGRR